MKLAVSLIALLGIGFLYSQTRPAILGQKSDAKYRIAVCVDLDGVATTDYLKMNCDRILNSGGQPVLYMGRDQAGRHLVLMKTP